MRAVIRHWPDETGGASQVLDGRAATIGRNDDNDIVLESALVSRYHARIEWTGAEYVVLDLQSTNGSWLNEDRLSAPAKLRDGDVLRFGDRAIIFNIDGAQTMHASQAMQADGLTARELEVLALLGAGRSNREIAAALVLSVRTVERHISNVYSKIGAHTRSEATAYALVHRLARRD